MTGPGHTLDHRTGSVYRRRRKGYFKGSPNRNRIDPPISPIHPDRPGRKTGRPAREQDPHSDELADVIDRPAPAARVLLEYNGVVVGGPIGVELGDHDVQHLSHEQQYKQSSAYEAGIVQAGG